MDFAISEKMQAVTGMMSEFVEKELIPMEPAFLRKDFKAMLPELAEKRRMVKQMELWAPNHPKELGGMGLDLMEHALVTQDQVVGAQLSRLQHLQKFTKKLVVMNLKLQITEWN